jgi:uncharacterized protein (DUF952 family)
MIIREQVAGAVFHIAERHVWDASSDIYVPSAFADEGFIHLSYADQVTATAERYYQDRQDLVLLRISRAQLGLDVVDENLLGGAELFPHLYAPLHHGAVEAVTAVVWDAQGRLDSTIIAGKN